MELKDFISSTLSEIAEGVNSAKEKYRTLGGEVNPKNMRDAKGDIVWGSESSVRQTVMFITDVQFEVSLTEASKDGVSGGIGVLFGVFSAGGKSEQANENHSFTKVRFNIPVKLP